MTKAGTTGGTVEYYAPVSKTATTVSIPSTIKAGGITYKVTSVRKDAFKNNKKLTKITIGSNLKTIGANAFYGCTKLKTVTLGTGVTTVGSKAFYGCKKLTSITVKTTKLKKIGSSAFKGIGSKATIKVPKTKLKTYTALCKKTGIGKNVKVKK